MWKRKLQITDNQKYPLKVLRLGFQNEDEEKTLLKKKNAWHPSYPIGLMNSNNFNEF